MADSSFSLLKTQRFLPFFLTQLSGAFNDTLLKSAFTLLVTFYAAKFGGLSSAMASNLIAGLFILPFLLFSATSGQLSDKFDKTRLMRAVKAFEVLIVSIAAYGFWFEAAWVLYVCVFLMGVHSTIFGPAKYAYLPQHLSANQVVGGNGLVEMATFVAILGGSIVAGELVHLGSSGIHAIALLCVTVALFGWAASRMMPLSPPLQSLKINWNPISEAMHNLRIARQDMAVFYAMIGISWLWFFGAIFLTHFAPLAKEMLASNERVVTLMLSTFSIGIGVGSVLCEKLSRHQLEIGLVPFGAIGMTVFGLDLYFAIGSFVRAGLPADEMGALAFLAHAGSLRLMVDLFLLSVFAGLYSVPLYTMIQTYAQPTHRARIIAANNILNALFMIMASLLALSLTALGANVAHILGVAAVLNALVAIYIFRLVPTFFLRFFAWVVSGLLYRVKYMNRDAIPKQGAAILVANHVSFVDALLLMAASPRPIRFVMDAQIFKMPVLSWVFRRLNAIPIASAKDDAFLMEQAFLQVAKELEDGQLVCIFPEGRLTPDGEIGLFRQGISKILALHAAPVIPCALQGLWGSFFSRKYGAAMTRPFVRGFFSKVQLVVGSSIPPELATPERLEAAVRDLRGDWA